MEPLKSQVYQMLKTSPHTGEEVEARYGKDSRSVLNQLLLEKLIRWDINSGMYKVWLDMGTK